MASTPSDERRGDGTVVDGAGGADRAGAATRDDRRLDRIVTVPNVITVVRLACLPLFVWLLLGADDRAAAAFLLAALGATDWVDGYVARRFDQVSTVGKVLDPVADRLLFVVAIVAIVIDGAAPLWFCLAVLFREVVVAGATLVLYLLRARRIDVTWYGKAGTFGLMFAFPLFVGGSSDLSWAATAEVLARICAVPGLVLSYTAAVMYVPLGRAALRAGRADRQRGVASPAG
jgi:cardiolipin synthase